MQNGGKSGRAHDDWVSFRYLFLYGEICTLHLHLTAFLVLHSHIHCTPILPWLSTKFANRPHSGSTASAS